MREIDTMAKGILDKDRLTPKLAADLCGVHRNTIHRWHRDGRRGIKLPFVWIGGKPYILRADLEWFIAALSDPRPADGAADDDDAGDRARVVRRWGRRRRGE